MAELTRTALIAAANLALADNTVEDITAAELRTSVVDLADSSRFRKDDLHRSLNGDVAHANDGTVQPWFATLTGATLPAASLYQIKGLLRLSHGTTSHTLSLSFGGTAVLNWIEYSTLHWAGVGGTPATAQATNHISVATGVAVAAASATAEEFVLLFGLVRVTTVGTLVPRFQYNTAPGGSPQTKRGTYFSIKHVGGLTEGDWV